MQPIPAGGDQLARIDSRTTSARRCNQLRGHFAAGPLHQGQRNAEVIGFDPPAGLGRGPFDRRLQLARLDYLDRSEAAARSLAENYAGLPAAPDF